MSAFEQRLGRHAPRSFVELIPTIRAIEMVHARLVQNVRRHPPRVYAHAIVRLVYGSPMGNAAASLAAVKFNDSVTPVAVQNLIRVTKRDKCGTATRDARIFDSGPACTAVGV